MTESEIDWMYWSVDIPGMSEAQAQQVGGFAEGAGIGVGATVVEPKLFMTLHIDRSTVSSVMSALEAALSGTSSSGAADLRVMSGILEAMQEWLEQAALE
jgi:hypothetical protein